MIYILILRHLGALKLALFSLSIRARKQRGMSMSSLFQCDDEGLGLLPETR